MKFLLLTLIFTIVFFFIWNILKRVFFSNFYNKTNPHHFENQKKTEDKISQKVNWDAETVDYEEVKEEKDSKKY